jgi:DNA repair photolyase
MSYNRVSAGRARQHVQDAETPLFQMLPPSLPSIERVRDHCRLLKTGPLPQQKDVLALHFVEGCVQGCTFCPVRAEGGGVNVRLVDNAAAALEVELRQLADKPRAVFVSPTTDPFPPLNDVQSATAQMVEVLARHGIDVWLMTRGYIRPAAMAVLRKHAGRVKVTMSITTLDRPMQRLLEPLTAPPRLRLRNLAALRDAGIMCQAALEPLMPGVTDTRENLLPLLEALAGVGVQHVTVGYLVLHARIEEAFLASLRPHGLDAIVADEYARAPVFSRVRGMPGRYLPRARRQHGYAALMAMAANFGLRVSVNAVTNPDFAVPPLTPSTIRAPLLQLVH